MKACKFYESKCNIQTGIFETLRMKENPGSKCKTGYRMLHLPLKGGGHKHEYVHRAIFQEATGFLIPEGFQIHHRDGDKDSNGIDNLCLCTSRFNNLEAAKTRDYEQIYLSRKKNGFKQKIKATSKDYEEVFPSQCQCAKALGICVSRISNILREMPNAMAHSKKTGKKYSFVKL